MVTMADGEGYQIFERAQQLGQAQEEGEKARNGSTSEVTYM